METATAMGTGMLLMRSVVSVLAAKAHGMLAAEVLCERRTGQPVGSAGCRVCGAHRL